MKVFLTGATGFIGSVLVPELLSAGHEVLGLTRSDGGAEALRAAGAQVHRGDLEDLDSLRQGAAQSEAVIHTAFNHDFTNFLAACEQDRRVIQALSEGLKGKDGPLLITSGTGIGNREPGQPALEKYGPDPNHPHPRAASELAGQAALDAGINVSIVRLPQVHDHHKQGLLTPAIELAQRTGKFAYLGDGSTRWPAAPVQDVSHPSRLVLERGERGSRWNAVAEEGITSKEIAEVLGQGLGLPVVSLTPAESQQHFGWLAPFMAMDMLASSAYTRATLNWQPTGPGLISDLKKMTGL
ncbi:NAD-dependent dehydratase [bacterium SCN 62-11]|nr:MAG: NAD-dependent dehydratase [bacterium SCN 62-11]